jgi:hypothetical protein
MPVSRTSRKPKLSFVLTRYAISTGPGSACQTNDGKNTTRLLPIFPAACPYLTSVGGTVGVQPERAVSFSSGGFSDIWPRPLYQEVAVSKYVRSIGDTFKGLYNPHGRGFPDVAAQGSRFVGITQGRQIAVGGTSASAPTFAAIVSLLNNARLSKGLRPLGFLNPWLYTFATDGLTDIVDGGSKGCTGKDVYSGLPAPYVPGAGWNATKGWVSESFLFRLHLLDCPQGTFITRNIRVANLDYRIPLLVSAPPSSTNCLRRLCLSFRCLLLARTSICRGRRQKR